MIGRQGGNYRIFTLLHLWGIKIYAIYVPKGGYVSRHIDNIPYRSCASMMVGLLPGSKHFFKSAAYLLNQSAERVSQTGAINGYVVNYDPTEDEHGSTPQSYPQLYLGIGVYGEKLSSSLIKIRFNHLASADAPLHRRWRAIIGDVEHLAENIYISTGSGTTKDIIMNNGEEVEKWHITTTGSPIWRRNDLYIV